jgi:uncharacterized protein (UPF0212 family)
MNFELKNAVSVGDVQSKDADNSLQFLNITVGVVGCPYNMAETKTVEYVFANNLTVQQAKDGVIPFAESWVATNYPNI